MIIYLMGVCGSGKTTIGHTLASELGWTFYDGDDFHSESNRAKMAKGVPLNDDDRSPWLRTINNLAQNEIENENSVIIACSALKFTYRNILRGGRTNENIRFIYLKMDQEDTKSRLKERKGHFFNAELIKSQFETLEEPRLDENDVIMVDGRYNVFDIVVAIRKSLGV